MKYKSKEHISKRLVRGEHLNHHGTLFAGIGAQWFVESGYIAAVDVLPAENMVCAKIDSLNFKKPVRAGQIICFHSSVASVGVTSIKTYTKVTVGSCDDILVDGYSVFVHVDRDTKPVPHGIELE
jgi:acyl-CoA hydrolase